MAATSSSDVRVGASSQASGDTFATQELAGTNRYRRLDEGSGLGAIGWGSFGRVYAAVDLQSDNTVVVKRQSVSSSAASRELLWYKALSQVPHPNVMKLLHHFTSSSAGDLALYMVFEFMDCSLWHSLEATAASHINADCAFLAA